MANREELETLRLFVAKAERLLASSFLRQAEQGLGWTLSGEKDQPVSLEIRGPSWESVEAFVLNLRFFIQYNEPISIASMEKIFSGTAATPEQRKTYHEERQKLNDYLGKSSMFQINGSKITNRDVMDTFVYGHLSHANPKKKQQFDKWMSNSIVGHALTSEFHTVLSRLLGTIAVLRVLCLRVIDTIDR